MSVYAIVPVHIPSIPEFREKAKEIHTRYERVRESAISFEKKCQKWEALSPNILKKRANEIIRRACRARDLANQVSDYWNQHFRPIEFISPYRGRDAEVWKKITNDALNDKNQAEVHRQFVKYYLNTVLPNKF